MSLMLSRCLPDLDSECRNRAKDPSRPSKMIAVKIQMIANLKSPSIEYMIERMPKNADSMVTKFGMREINVFIFMSLTICKCSLRLLLVQYEMKR